jgi:hypothetical protein
MLFLELWEKYKLKSICSHAKLAKGREDRKEKLLSFKTFAYFAFFAEKAFNQSLLTCAQRILARRKIR